MVIIALFSELTKTLTFINRSNYNVEMRASQIFYNKTNIDCLKMGTRGADVLARDIMFSQLPKGVYRG